MRGPSLRARMTAKNRQRQVQKQIPSGMEERKAKAKADPYGMTTKEQVQTQIPFGNDKRKRDVDGWPTHHKSWVAHS